MDPFDALMLVGELSLGIAGFSGVVVALGKRPTAWARVDRIRLATLLAASLGAMFYVLLALLLTIFIDDRQVVWRVSSLFVAVHLLAMLVAFVPAAWSITRETTGLTSPYSIAVFIPIVVLSIAMLIVQVLSAAKLLPLDPFGAFFAGLVALLLISGTQFVRLLFAGREADGT